MIDGYNKLKEALNACLTRLWFMGGHYIIYGCCVCRLLLMLRERSYRLNQWGVFYLH